MAWRKSKFSLNLNLQVTMWATRRPSSITLFQTSKENGSPLLRVGGDLAAVDTD